MASGVIKIRVSKGDRRDRSTTGSSVTTGRTALSSNILVSETVSGNPETNEVHLSTISPDQRTYSLMDIQTIKNTMISTIDLSTLLSETVLRKIRELDAVVVQFIPTIESAAAAAGTNVETGQRKFSDKSESREHHANYHTGGTRFYTDKKRASDETDNWNAGKSFKTTPKLVKDGVDKNITDIRMALNKLTTKNYNNQKEVIIQLITQIIQEEPETDDEKTQQITKIIFDIASSNKIMSELYAELYKTLIGQFNQFQKNMLELLNNYKTSFNDIHFVDPNIDYDGYCKYTKTNDVRKSMTLFIVNLMCKQVIDENSVMDTIVYLENLFIKYAEETDRKNEVEEITENLFILLTQGAVVLKNSAEWTEKILPNIRYLCTLKKTDGDKYPSMTNRATFKYMDILDALKPGDRAVKT